MCSLIAVDRCTKKRLAATSIANAIATARGQQCPTWLSVGSERVVKAARAKGAAGAIHGAAHADTHVRVRFVGSKSSSEVAAAIMPMLVANQRRSTKERVNCV